MMRQKVYEFLKTVPPGKVVTYGQIAQHLGNANLSRAVGNILHINPDPAHIPCHRVVNSKGQVSHNFAFGGADAQRALLAREGIAFDVKGRVDLDKYRFKE